MRGAPVAQKEQSYADFKKDFPFDEGKCVFDMIEKKEGHPMHEVIRAESKNFFAVALGDHSFSNVTQKRDAKAPFHAALVKRRSGKTSFCCATAVAASYAGTEVTIVIHEDGGANWIWSQLATYRSVYRELSYTPKNSKPAAIYVTKLPESDSIAFLMSRLTEDGKSLHNRLVIFDEFTRQPFLKDISCGALQDALIEKGFSAQVRVCALGTSIR